MSFAEVCRIWWPRNGTAPWRHGAPAEYSGALECARAPAIATAGSSNATTAIARPKRTPVAGSDPRDNARLSIISSPSPASGEYPCGTVVRPARSHISLASPQQETYLTTSSFVPQQVRTRLNVDHL